MQNMKNIIAIGGVSAAIGLASLCGCSTFKNDKPNDQRSEGRVVDDNNITKSVEERLKKEPVYKFENVDVRTYSGIVQLSGFVDTHDQKSRAEQIARGAGGVAQIVNGLVVKPAPMPTPTGKPSGQQQSPPPATTEPAPNN
jgi:osmotically-inducible protein OsmY